METSKTNVNELIRRLIMSKMRILMKNPFYGLLLTHVTFGVDDSCNTAYTDGKKIMFSTKFMNELLDSELDIVLMHELMHIALRHCYRGLDLDPMLYNIACDTVVNSNVMHSLGDNLTAISLRCDPEPYHLAPNGKEGYLYTAEEVYQMYIDYAVKNKFSNATVGKSNKKNAGNSSDKSECANGSKTTKDKNNGNQSGFDDHTKWDRTSSSDSFEEDEMNQLIKQVAEAVSGGDTAGNLPFGIERKLQELNSPKHDWREILNNFVQEEVNDYTFSPPDRRYDGDFYLPDFNGVDVSVKNVLFMIDTSGSMSNKTITEMYSEIKGAIDQFDGKLEGWLGFFDAKVVEPKPFKNLAEFQIIQPKGGGGTNFSIVFEYVEKNMTDEKMPSAIIILTDGFAPFPAKEKTLGIPVLWVISSSVTPPYGKVIRV